MSTILAAILWVVQTGAAWRDLPAHVGPWETASRRYQRWRRAGVWQRVLESLKPADAHVSDQPAPCSSTG